MKREVLVHECGHIINPGDEIVVDRNYSADVRVGTRYIFMGIAPRGYGDSSGRYIRVSQPDNPKAAAHFVRTLKRFNCTIVEIDDEEEKEEVHPSA